MLMEILGYLALDFGRLSKFIFRFSILVSILGASHS